MSKHYSDRYVGNQSSGRSVNYYKSATDGSLLETIICLCLGSIVFYVLCLMTLTQMKPLMAKVAEIQHEQSVQIDELKEILSE